MKPRYFRDYGERGYVYRISGAAIEFWSWINHIWMQACLTRHTIAWCEQHDNFAEVTEEDAMLAINEKAA